MEARNKSCAKFDPSGWSCTSFGLAGPRFFTKKRFASTNLAVDDHPSGWRDVTSHIYTGDEHIDACDEFPVQGNNDESDKTRVRSASNNAVVSHLEVDQAFSVQAVSSCNLHVSSDKQRSLTVLAFAGAPACSPVASH